MSKLELPDLPAGAVFFSFVDFGPRGVYASGENLPLSRLALRLEDPGLEGSLITLQDAAHRDLGTIMVPALVDRHLGVSLTFTLSEP